MTISKSPLIIVKSHLEPLTNKHVVVSMKPIVLCGLHYYERDQLSHFYNKSQNQFESPLRKAIQAISKILLTGKNEH